jgi:hypothetical protein
MVPIDGLGVTDGRGVIKDPLDRKPPVEGIDGREKLPLDLKPPPVAAKINVIGVNTILAIKIEINIFFILLPFVYPFDVF